MSDLKFTKTDVPDTTRATKPNPFADVLPVPKGEAISTSLPKGTKESAVAALVRQAQQAGRAKDTTTRVKREGNEKDGWKLTFWSTDKIERKTD